MATVIAKDSYRVYSPKQKRSVVITKGEALDEKHDKVKLARWAFITPEEALEDKPPVFTPEGMEVEAATAAPGEKRTVKRGAKKK
jgi:hypothetical protein